MNEFVFLDILRPTEEIKQQILRFSVAIVHDVCNEVGLMDNGIYSLNLGNKMCGPAITIQTQPRDNLGVHKALTIAKPGDVLVIDGCGLLDVAMWGNIMSRAALAKKVAGVVIDGCIRDRADIRALNFPVWSRGVCPISPKKRKVGSINCPVQVGGVLVYPGDLILADDDGVAVIQQDKLSIVLEMGEQRMKKELKYAHDLVNGKTTIELLDLQPYLDELNLTIIASDYQSWEKNNNFPTQ